MFHVVLIEPEIPSNTGNIARTCVGFEAALHLVHPLGFQIDDKHLRRAGLDYWPHLKLKQHNNWQQWWQSVQHQQQRVFFFSSRAHEPYFKQKFQAHDHLVFGSETKGLPPQLLQQNQSQSLCIPFSGPVRCFNLSNAVSIALAEAVRQITH